MVILVLNNVQLRTDFRDTVSTASAKVYGDQRANLCMRNSEFAKFIGTPLRLLYTLLHKVETEV